MATFYSVQRANDVAAVPVPNDPRMKSKPFYACWEYTTPASGMPTVGDYIELVKLPSGARIIDGESFNEAMSTGGGTAGYDIGYSGADTRYGAAIDVDAAGSDRFANTIALNHADVLTAEKVIRAKVTGEQWAASKKFFGYIRYTLA